jgi:hypothetical protein
MEIVFLQREDVMKVGKQKEERKKLLQRQARFINLLLEAKYTTEEIIAKIGVGRRTLARWRSERLFRREWTSANRTLAMRRGSDEAISGIRAANQEVGRIREAGEVEMAGAGEGEAGMESEEAGVGGRDGAVSEREMIRRRHGEEAAQAFDHLVKMREEGEGGRGKDEG